MDTNEHQWQSGEETLLTPEEEILHKMEVFAIVGAAMSVLNELGHGLDEKPYENALVVEFGLRRIPFQQQPSFQNPLQGPSSRPLYSRSRRLRLGGGRCQGDRAYHRTRMGTDAQLFENHGSARRRDFEFCEVQTRMGTPRSLSD